MPHYHVKATNSIAPIVWYHDGSYLSQLHHLSTAFITTKVYSHVSVWRAEQIVAGHELPCEKGFLSTTLICLR
jgi:hypothetical protein